ncbi:DJ-1/PfpI family protein [Bacillus sp. FJAT-27245]|uniref:DJ-1/PfpI family protein n=1 Tax=Bacillus sp. FJAT-27245 TaxID=1684144 RepID=UPI0006A79B1F|nr:DJ-1/PfpI family protein [Bacillus sp. FJAT-27245]
MKKTAVVLYPQFSEYELSVALSILMQGGKPIVTVGLKQTPIMGESGLTCVADTTVNEVNMGEIDSLLLPGCMDIGTLLHEQELFDFVGKIGAAGHIIASISSSPFLLAKAGVLKGKKYTVGLPMEGIIKSGVFEMDNYSPDMVVQDGNIITARGSAFVRFGVTFGKALSLDFDGRWYRE